MLFYLSTISIVLFANFLILFSLGVYLLMAKGRSGANVYAFLMFAVSIWALFGAMEMTSLTLPMRILFAKLAYLGILGVGPFWLLFTLKYVGARERLQKAAARFAGVIYLIFLPLVFTNNYHNLLWNNYVWMGHSIEKGVLFTPGPIWYVNVSLQYALIALGVVVLVRAARKEKSANRHFLRLIVFATMIPWVANFLFITFGESLTQGADLAPITFAISGLIIAFSIFKYDDFATISAAVGAVYHNMGVGIIIFDLDGRVLDFNGAAEIFVGKSLYRGANILKINKVTQISFSDIVAAGKRQSVVHSSQGRWFEISADKVQNDRGIVIGNAVSLYDVSRQRSSQDELDRQLKKLSKTNELMVGRELKMIELKKEIAKLGGKK